ncbi:tyrosine-type recombinase/integrase [Algibacter sp. PT7-4]|uniref:tyrosine-type recombinase/integrase n=1 Tax=Algibacter ulvanivorans TaxID=3400999 RepID=UPI003AAFB811
MQKSEKRQNIVFIDFIPAELHANKTWEIVYYVKHPVTEKLTRKRNRVKPLKSITERKKLAKRMVFEINKRLEEGWNPFNQNEGAKELTKLIDAINIFKTRASLEYKEGNHRFDTFKTYTSQLNQLTIYITDVVNKPEMMCFKFNSDFINNYLDYIRYKKNRSARTRDNYLNFIRTFASFLISKKYITTNPTEHFTKINRQRKKRNIISDEDLKRIFEFWKNKNKHYLTLCLTCYYCLIRRTEITNIKVSDVSIKNSTLYIGAENSKNRKSNSVTIPNLLLPVLKAHIKGFKATNYLFSNTFNPGLKKLSPDMVTKKWSFMRKKLNLESHIHWYSLKDTGITNMLKAGIPTISVRDQARHHSITQTEAYTPKEILKANMDIKSVKI